jgi:hypothetical protein
MWMKLIEEGKSQMTNEAAPKTGPLGSFRDARPCDRAYFAGRLRSNKHLGYQRNKLARIRDTPLSGLLISIPEDVVICFLPPFKILD